MDYEVMRLECLKLATAQGLKGDEAIAAAAKMIAFAREGSLIDKAYGSIQTPLATIRKRPPFLDDYKPD